MSSALILTGLFDTTSEMPGRRPSRPTHRTRSASPAEDYERTLQQVLRKGAWLMGPQAELLPESEWNARYERYQKDLAELRHQGNQARPVSLRSRNEPLDGADLRNEVLELFAA